MSFPEYIIDEMTLLFTNQPATSDGFKLKKLQIRGNLNQVLHELPAILNKIDLRFQWKSFS